MRPNTSTSCLDLPEIHLDAFEERNTLLVSQQAEGATWKTRTSIAPRTCLGPKEPAGCLQAPSTTIGKRSTGDDRHRAGQPVAQGRSAEDYARPCRWQPLIDLIGTVGSVRKSPLETTCGRVSSTVAVRSAEFGREAAVLHARSSSGPRRELDLQGRGLTRAAKPGRMRSRARNSSRRMADESRHQHLRPNPRMVADEPRHSGMDANPARNTRGASTGTCTSRLLCVGEPALQHRVACGLHSMRKLSHGFRSLDDEDG